MPFSDFLRLLCCTSFSLTLQSIRCQSLFGVKPNGNEYYVPFNALMDMTDDSIFFLLKDIQGTILFFFSFPKLQNNIKNNEERKQ